MRYLNEDDIISYKYIIFYASIRFPDFIRRQALTKQRKFRKSMERNTKRTGKFNRFNKKEKIQLLKKN